MAVLKPAHRVMVRLVRAVALCLVTLMLAGCVLQSKQPIFADKSGKMALAAYGERFAIENFSNGKWTREEDVLTARPSGKHYVVSNDKSPGTADILFAQGAAGWLVMQMRSEPDKPYVYILAKPRKADVLLRPLMCEDLKKMAGAADSVRFDGEDCSVVDGKAKTLFKLLAAAPLPETTRLVPLQP